MPHHNNDDISSYKCFANDTIAIGNSSLSSFIVGVAILLYSSSLFFIIRKNYIISESTRFNAFFIPIYNYHVIFIIIISIIIGIINIIGDNNTNIVVVLDVFTLKWFVYQLNIISLTVFFMNQGIGYKAIKRSIVIGLLWSIITTTCSFVMTSINQDIEDIATMYMFFISLEIIFELFVWLLPHKLLYRRPAALFISKVFIVLHLITFGFLLSVVLSPEEGAVCALKVYSKLLDFIQPVLLFRSMQLDSRFWQGLYISSESNLNQPLLGIWEMGRQTLTAVTDCVSVFEKKVINIIPFNYLNLDTSGFIAGGASRVYKGNCTGIDRVVAVKILFCMELTPERIVQFCEEATLLNSLNHPNIVTCYGVALMPPAISLVTEYCHYGSLFNFLHTYDVIRDSFRDDSVSDSTEEQNQRVVRISDVSSISFASYKLYDNSSSIGTKEQELSARSITNQIKDSLLSANYSATSSENMIRRVESAIGNKDDEVHRSLTNATEFMASKEMRFGLGLNVRSANRISITNANTNVNALHDNSINSNNRNSLPLFSGSVSKQTLGNFLPLDFKVKLCYECCSGIAYLHSKGFVHNDIKSLNFLVSRDLTVKLSDLGETRQSNSSISATELPTNINWSAPEILNGNETVQKSADVWGLALVMSEILTGAIPFDLPEYRKLQMNTFSANLKEGLRPEIPRDIKESKYKWLCDLIEEAWVYDANKRCSAEYLVKEFDKNLRN